jgi:hypothetical protein
MTFSVAGVATLYVTAVPDDETPDKHLLKDTIEVHAGGGLEAAIRSVHVKDSSKFAVEGQVVVDISGPLQRPPACDLDEFLAEQLAVDDSDGPDGECRELIHIGGSFNTPVPTLEEHVEQAFGTIALN